MVPYAQYPKGTADLMAYATAADPCFISLVSKWVDGFTDHWVNGLMFEVLSSRANI